MSLDQEYQSSLLLAICAYRNKDYFDIDKMYDVFGAIILESNKSQRLPQQSINLNFLTGRYNELDELLLEGFNNCYIHVNPDYTRIEFNLEVEPATIMINERPGVRDYKNLAQIFWKNI
ncbi:MAG: hypothetical protein Q8Q35_01775 [Nanoarchaeota archaeon]|nr:hypothetical protein [Nanoarchaeota archaeon]